MQIFGITFGRRPKALTTSMNAVNQGGGGWFHVFGDTFTGAWQRNVKVDDQRGVLAFSAVFACVTGIAGDIAKLCPGIVKKDDDGIFVNVDGSSPFTKVLKRPNRYQNRIKFIEQWVISKLLHGAAYVLKQRDKRGIVTALYVLDPQRVTPLVAEDGGVYYRIEKDALSGVKESIVVPASEIIHDMMICLWHPLVGVSPIYACGVSATMGNRIQADSTQFFENLSRPSGQLTAPGKINDETANRLKREFEEKFSGVNIGRLFVAGDGLKYEAMKIPAHEAQLIEQLKWTVEDVARAFHVPLYKVGGPIPPQTSVEALNQTYYSECLQTLIESIELCLDEGLALPPDMRTEFDLDGLLRMDTAARYETKNKAVSGGWMAPNEARKGENLKPVTGGETPYMQQQNYSLAALAKRDARNDPWASKGGNQAPSDPAAEDDAADQMAERLANAFIARCRAETEHFGEAAHG